MAPLDAPTTYSGNNALQEDAVSMALKTFGISPGEYAESIEMIEGPDTALSRVNIWEDAVIQHDARYAR